MCAIDGAGFDWSNMAEDEIQANMALMAFTDSEVSNDKSWIAVFRIMVLLINKLILPVQKLILVVEKLILLLLKT
ncbi:hypothetical protein Tco_0480047 [Tanacetum coccineum]